MSIEYDIYVQCTRCRHKHMESQRLKVPCKKFPKFANDLVCPKCNCKSFYRLDETPPAETSEGPKA